MEHNSNVVVMLTQLYENDRVSRCTVCVPFRLPSVEKTKNDLLSLLYSLQRHGDIRRLKACRKSIVRSLT